MKDAVRARREMLNSDMHCAGYALDPEVVEHNVTANKVSFFYQTIHICAIVQL